MKYLFGFSLFLLSSANVFAAEEDHQTIKSVMNAFEQSIIEKDKERFLSLFVSADAPMYGVVSERSMVKRRKLVAEINKKENKNFPVTKHWTSSPEKMMNRIVNSTLQSKEVFSNVRITTDNDIAVVYSDYEYFKGTKKNNWGSESWHMIRTVKGWKIGSIHYSITFPE